ncbi:AAA domain-containing protein [Dactylosporangium sp. CA-152071]|uniref:AAA domain-containing protein n=1 Tax=Dactylosporangium sp. CA-152071 TaxID=3239933 RepID=UPI003D90EAB5
MSNDDAPGTIRDRALALADYLMAVRARMEKPSRTVPTSDAFWQHQLPIHPACEVGVAGDDATWLRVALPPLPKPVSVPREFAPLLQEALSADQEPALRSGTDAAVQARFRQWRDEAWRPWAAEVRIVKQVRQLHDRLFELKHTLDMNSATNELVWGHGIVAMTIDGETVRYPLVTTPVMVDYDPDRSLITVAPQGSARLQTDALSGLPEHYLRQLLELGQHGGQVAVNVWEEYERIELFERAMRRLGMEPAIRAAHAPAPDGPNIQDTSVLFVRPKQRMIRRFLEELRGRLEAGDTASIGALAAILAHEPTHLQMPGDQPERWRQVGQRLLMPLPTNEAQESIARRLAQHRNVAVQGPPGTGKTHTIRNLICHLIAHGKRVLVVAQKEDPLRVLRDGLPAEVQPLCLAVLGRSTDQLIQLQLAARELSDRAATLDHRMEQRTVDSITAQLEKAEADLGHALGNLRTIAESDSVTFKIDNVALSPAEVGAWLLAREDRYGDIPDELHDGDQAPLTADEFGVVLDLAHRISRADRQQALRHLPLVADLPTAATIQQMRSRTSATAAAVDDLARNAVDVHAVRQLGEHRLAELLSKLREAVTYLYGREGSWTGRLGRLIADPHLNMTWRDHVTATEQLLGQISAMSRTIGGHRVEVAAIKMGQPRALLTELAELRQRYNSGKGVSKLFASSLAKLSADCRVDGEPLRSTEDVDVVVAFVNRIRLRQDLGARWAEWAQRLGFQLPTGPAEPELWAGRFIADANNSLEWDWQHWPALYRVISVLLPRSASNADAQALDTICTRLDQCQAIFEHDRLVEQARTVSAALQQGMATVNASELWRLLDLDWQSANLTVWDSTLAEARRLAALYPDAETYRRLHTTIAVAAPAWAAAIDDGSAPALSGSGADCVLRWQWRQAQTWFDNVVGSVDTDGLGRRVAQTRDRIRRLTNDLVVRRAWLEVSRALDDRRRAALADWATALRKYGKGTGKNAAKWQAYAQQAMTDAIDAVPVWVMPLDRAIEQFTGGAKFDVVIVDEASQADLFALPVLTLAERAVVVGDDQQIGPQLNFVSDVTGLVNAHLAGEVPSAEQFDTEGSLYDHAVRRSPQRIRLTEHFRCVPAIIEFSSREYYDNAIEPLRTDRPQGIGDPVRTVYVPEGIRQAVGSYGDVNVAEADALVEQVTTIIGDPAYRGKTIGVVSLLSTSDQALYILNRIRSLVGEEEISRRRLRVGDSYTFQGDERDVVLVTLVVSPHRGSISAFTKREYHRRVNVAASRARDQLWVFHSVQPEDLNPEDARGKLLRYCQNVTNAEDAYDNLEQRCDSDFERAVLKHLLLRGYRPLPQFRIGSYRIDFVLLAPDGRRLAIECDGDPYHGPDHWEGDIRRQTVLERVGNCVFVRIRGSVFSRDPAAAMEPVWHRIEELGIGLYVPPPAVEPVVETAAPDPIPEPEPPVVTPTIPEEILPFSIEQQREIARLISLGKTVTIGPDGAVQETAPEPAPLPSTPPTASAPDRADATATATVAPPVPRPRAAASPVARTSAPAPADAQDAEVMVPVGYRSVAWIRPHEALAAIQAYQQTTDTPIRHEGKVVGWARYYQSASEEARKYRSNVVIERAHPTGAKFVCWVRQQEARAVLAAAKHHQDAPVLDTHSNVVGLVQYFPPTNPAALRFLSVTRVLRITHNTATSPPPFTPAEPPVDLSSLSALETRFHRAMVRLYERARDEAGYTAKAFHSMLAAKGGPATARQLLNTPTVSDGFTELWERGRLDLTVETLALRPEFAPLFTQPQLDTARSRLANPT